MIKQIHFRVEQKFRDYRTAFRKFDLNFDGGLSFEEFVTCCEWMGVSMPLTDFKMVFETIDYDKTGEIDFSKFCLFNTDKTNDVVSLIKTLKLEKSK